MLEKTHDAAAAVVDEFFCHRAVTTQCLFVLSDLSLPGSFPPLHFLPLHTLLDSAPLINLSRILASSSAQPHFQSMPHLPLPSLSCLPSPGYSEVFTEGRSPSFWRCINTVRHVLWMLCACWRQTDTWGWRVEEERDEWRDEEEWKRASGKGNDTAWIKERMCKIGKWNLSGEADEKVILHSFGNELNSRIQMLRKTEYEKRLVSADLTVCRALMQSVSCQVPYLGHYSPFEVQLTE